MADVSMRRPFLRALEELDASCGEALPSRVKDMVRLRVSHLNGCAHSIKLHSEALAGAGVRVDLISALARPVSLMRADLVTPAEAASLRFAEILSDAPRGLEAQGRRMLAEHLSPEEIGALVEVIAVTHAWNRVDRGAE